MIGIVWSIIGYPDFKLSGPEKGKLGLAGKSAMKVLKKILSSKVAGLAAEAAAGL